MMETVNGTGPAYSEGLAAHFDVMIALDAFLIGLAETDPDTYASPGPPSDTEEADTLAWQYQYCTEFGTPSPFHNKHSWPGLIDFIHVGFFKGANPNNYRSIQSRFLTQEDIQKDCSNTFPGAVPPEPNPHVLNNAYGGWHMNPTHVFFTNGQIDPWRTLSIASVEQNSPKRTGSIAIPA